MAVMVISVNALFCLFQFSLAAAATGKKPTGAVLQLTIVFIIDYSDEYFLT